MINFNLSGRIHRICLLRVEGTYVGIRVMAQVNTKERVIYDISFSQLKEMGIEEPEVFCSVLEQVCVSVRVLDLIPFKGTYCTELESKTLYIIPMYHYRKHDIISLHLESLWVNHLKPLVQMGSFKKNIVYFSPYTMMGVSEINFYKGYVNIQGDKEGSIYIGSNQDFPMDFNVFKDWDRDVNILLIENEIYTIVRGLGKFHVEVT